MNTDTAGHANYYLLISDYETLDLGVVCRFSSTLTQSLRLILRWMVSTTWSFHTPSLKLMRASKASQVSFLYHLVCEASGDRKLFLYFPYIVLSYLLEWYQNAMWNTKLSLKRNNNNNNKAHWSSSSRGFYLAPIQIWVSKWMYVLGEAYSCITRRDYVRILSYCARV